MLPPLPESIATAALELLRRLDVDVRTGERVTGVEPTACTWRAASCSRADLVVWAAGIQAPPLLSRSTDSRSIAATSSSCSRHAADHARPGRLRVRRLRRLPLAARGKPNARVPPRAQAARQQAQLLVKTIEARLAGKPLPVFRFRDYGSLVSLGELSAVGNLMGTLIGGNMLIQGLIARWMYESLYKMHQVSLLGVLRVALDTVGRFLRGRVGRA